uniref:ADAMTS/ADAMTS-like cysteine-rich domain-containing protein n=1 Tax=Meloidogyne enterolobii TaxID=390850 RepID=A0A6V7XMA7_MELEN|nr:unnamed protein product [Meloidogyne enterolobii]
MVFPVNCPSFTKSVCFQGYCQPFGCDKIIGSLTKEDQCGVCGGNGSSCFNNLFKWKERKEEEKEDILVNVKENVEIKV